MFSEPPQTPRLKKFSSFLPGAPLPNLALGDQVQLPDGQQAILRYVGPIESKNGEYAGIELIDEWANQGLHSGEYRGVQYFETSQPGSGLFIPYLKLLNAQTPLPQLASPHKIVSTKRNPVASSKIPLFASPRAKRLDFATLQGTSPTRTFSADSAESGDSVIINSSSVANEADTAAAVALAISKTQAEAQKQIAELRDELEIYKSEIKEREQILEEQSQLLKDLESTVVEFQNLKEQEEAARVSATEENTIDNNNDDDEKTQMIDMLRAQLEDKERKIGTLKGQLEQRRAEFRATLEDMQREMEDSNSAFEDEIKALQQRLRDAEKLAQHVSELEQVVAELEALNAGGNNKGANNDDADLRANVAELESKLHERDATIDDLKTQLSETKQELAGYSVSRRISNIGGGGLPTNPAANGDGSSSTRSRGSSLVLEEDSNERLRQQLKTEREKRIMFEAEIANLESVVETRIFREEELEQELAQLRAENKRLQGLAASAAERPLTPMQSSSTPKMGQRVLSYNHAAADIDQEAVLMMGTAASDPSDIEATTTMQLPAIAIGSPNPAKKQIDLAAGRSKWCGLCERDGHESIECPFENDF
ncbi:hypothetical protein D0Z00_001482 [Geotrichum galactomycetum]|uniref:Uncharacterized protein n=1 Tax=Geotrichum galactomycetum TaxID=27317 RepID=A0ACB6V6R4_9ASCO|nr:hypothetical protein D0Z00_001482 [Geotrichum candidum]